MEFPLSEAIVPNAWLPRGQFFKVLQNCCKNIIAHPFRTHCALCTKVCRTIEKQAPNGKSNSARSLFWLYHAIAFNRKISVIIYWHSFFLQTSAVKHKVAPLTYFADGKIFFLQGYPAFAELYRRLASVAKLDTP